MSLGPAAAFLTCLQLPHTQAWSRCTTAPSTLPRTSRWRWLRRKRGLRVHVRRPRHIAQPTTSGLPCQPPEGSQPCKLAFPELGCLRLTGPGQPLCQLRRALWILLRSNRRSRSMLIPLLAFLEEATGSPRSHEDERSPHRASSKLPQPLHLQQLLGLGRRPSDQTLWCRRPAARHVHRTCRCRVSKTLRRQLWASLELGSAPLKQSPFRRRNWARRRRSPGRRRGRRSPQMASRLDRLRGAAHQKWQHHSVTMPALSPALSPAPARVSVRRGRGHLLR